MSEREAAPQDLETKLSQGSGTQGKAQASLDQLRKLFGGVKVLEQDARGVVRLSVKPMAEESKWVRISKDVYEKETP